MRRTTTKTTTTTMMMTMMMKMLVLMLLTFSLSRCHALAAERTTVYSMGYIWRNTTEKAKAAVVKPDLSEGMVPQSFDWRKKGVLTPIQTQGHCGSCWAFSAVETVESALAIATGETPVPLSVEQILVCCQTQIHSQCSSCMGGVS